MAKAPLLEIEALLAVIPGDVEGGLKGAGNPNLYDDSLRDEIEELRREGADPNEPDKPPKKADWKKVEDRCKETLLKSSKDLRVACYLTEALVKQHGMSGLRYGFALLRRLCDVCWDRVYPAMEGGDVDMRLEPLANMLDTPDRGLKFPATLMQVPLIRGKKGDKVYEKSFVDQEIAQRPTEKAKLEEFNQAVLACSPEHITTELDALTAGKEECTELVKTIMNQLKKMPVKGGERPPEAPGFTKVRDTVEKCLALARFVASKVAPPKAPEPTEAEKAAAAKPGAPAQSSGKATRLEIYRQLSSLAGQLKEMEPHSPIPFLIQRCCDLGAMSFPELMKELARDDKVVKEMFVQLGIKDAAPAPAGKTPPAKP